MKIEYIGADHKKIRLRAATHRVITQIAQMRHNPKIRYVVLFGSEARGEAVLTSDVDLALVSDEPLSADERLEFGEIFEHEHFPEYRVINTLTKDLDTENFMDVNYHIKKDGTVIYER